MILEEAIAYILPYAKMMSKKGTGDYLLLDNMLLYMNDQQSQLYSVNLPQPTGFVISFSKQNLMRYMKDPIANRGLPFMDYKMYYTILDNISKYNNFISTTRPIAVSDFVTTELQYAQLKSDSPPIYYNLDNVAIITLFYGMLPVNKSDTVITEVYDYDATSQLVRFVISKSKPKSTLYVYMRILKMR